ncbi:hypothetical protein PAXRUDRAFT_15394 [Paxillus rubicundulus Ve08.2h10]|uniref:DUF6533 domain-containing protein n=1 Tax=Paxillus rubicundulus Ve08.2h10 TaxID=930991 RepID=A0A0D0DI09_9AGAM|nr:hypothetical protein PAXRUDRAFT_15394 [Paxillus rubicundulus Ve08.2h10]
MPSLNTVLDGLQLRGYISVASVVAVFYDYVLTFSREVDLIWGRSWSMMSTLFIAARYLGLVLTTCHGLSAAVSVLAMSQPVSHSTFTKSLWLFGLTNRCVAVTQFLAWGGSVYLFLTQAIMIIRITVMFDCPKRMAYILSFLYSLVVIDSLITEFLWIGPHSDFIVSTVSLAGDTICTAKSGRGNVFPVYGGIPEAIFDLLILALSLYRFAVHSIETRRILGRTKVNVYMRLLLEHSVLYFVLIIINKGLGVWIHLSSSMLYVALASLYCATVPFMLFPRLVLSFKGHRSESGGLSVGSDIQRSHSRSHSHSASSGSPSCEEYRFIDIISPGRLPQGSKKGGPEIV